eukprot:7929290-Lingulodinium_polyedra.AAC.1
MRGWGCSDGRMAVCIQDLLRMPCPVHKTLCDNARARVRMHHLKLGQHTPGATRIMRSGTCNTQWRNKYLT